MSSRWDFPLNPRPKYLVLRPYLIRQSRSDAAHSNHFILRTTGLSLWECSIQIQFPCFHPSFAQSSPRDKSPNSDFFASPKIISPGCNVCPSASPYPLGYSILITRPLILDQGATGFSNNTGNYILRRSRGVPDSFLYYLQKLIHRARRPVRFER